MQSNGQAQIFLGTALALFSAGTLGAAAASEASLTIAEGDDVIEVEGRAYKKLEPASPKYTAALVDTPRSLTVIGEELLEDTAAQSLADALRTVPGISMAMGEGGQPFADRPFIRGSESTSGLLVDGLRDSSAQSRDVYNLEQIEVARGPNGAFAGRGAAGGSVNLVTKRAKAETAASLTARYGNEDQKRAEADVNVAVSEQVGLRINALWQESGVPGRDAVFDDRLGLAGSVTFGLASPTKLSLSVEHFETDGLIDYGHPLDLATGQPVEGIDPDNFYGLIARDFHRTELDSAILEVSRELTDSVMVRNVTRLAQSGLDYIASNPDDSRGNVANGLVQRVVKSTNSTTDILVNQTDLIARFDTGGIAHSISTGVDYTTEETSRATYNVEQVAPGGAAIPRGGCDLFGAGVASGYNCTDLFSPDPYDPWTGAISLNEATDTEAETFGAYAFDTLELSDRVLINLGVRYDDFSTETSTGLSNDDSFVTYQAGIVYKPLDNGSVYASYGTSASPAGVTTGDGSENIRLTTQDLEPEKGRNYEIGTKWRLYGGRLALEGAVFRTEIRDDHVAVEAGRNGAREAIGETRVQGVELSAVGQLTDSWSIFAGYSFLDSEVVEAGPVNAATEGNQLPNTPEHSVSLWTTVALTDALNVGGGAQYQSERFGNTANTRSVDGFLRVDGFASYTLSERAALQLNMQNLTDERYYDRVYSNHMATIAPGRSVTGTLRLSF